MTTPGKFIVLEGLDGCGSTTQTKNLCNTLCEKGIPFLQTCEPTNNIVGGLIRGALTKQWKTSPHGLQLLFCADRAHHLEHEILPALKNGTHVICDRYDFSTIAYGSLACDTKWLKELNKYFHKPDLVFYMQVPVEECLRRINERDCSQNELFEEEQKLKKVSEIYNQLAQTESNVITLDGTQNMNSVSEKIWNEVEKII